MAVGLAVAVGLVAGIIASDSSDGGSGGAQDALADGDAPRLNGETGADRRRIHRGVPTRGLAQRGILSPSEAYLLSSAAQLRDERIDARRGNVTEVGPNGTLSLYPIDGDDRYGYLVRVAAIGRALVEIGDSAAAIRDRRALTREATALRTQSGRIAHLVRGLDGSLYWRSQWLHGIVVRAADRIDRVVDSKRVAAVAPIAVELAAIGRSITGELRRASSAASSGDRAGAAQLLRGVDRNLALIEDAVQT